MATIHHHWWLYNSINQSITCLLYSIMYLRKFLPPLYTHFKTTYTSPATKPQVTVPLIAHQSQSFQSLDNATLAFKAHHSVALSCSCHGGLHHLCPRTKLSTSETPITGTTPLTVDIAIIGNTSEFIAPCVLAKEILFIFDLRL